MLRRPVEPGQYTSVRLTERLSLEHVAASIGSVGDAYDALIEPANGLYKTECVRTTIFHAGPYRTIVDVEFATAAWVDRYDCSRLHSSIGLIPPTEFETLYYAALNPRTSPQWRRHKTSGDSICVGTDLRPRRHGFTDDTVDRVRMLDRRMAGQRATTHG